MRATDARALILSGDAPEHLSVEGLLDLSGERRLTHLPAGLRVTRLAVKGCWNLKALPERLRAWEVDASDSGIACVPASVAVENRLDLSGCASLRRLPEGLKVGTLNVSGCTSLEALPEGLEAAYLDISDCVALAAWPKRARLGPGRLRMRGCTQLTGLPPYLTRLAQLDISGCPQLESLPDGLIVTGWLDVSGSGVRALPDSLLATPLRWRGVSVDARVVFAPETLTGKDVLSTSNAETRRVILERLGMERFFAEVRPHVLDIDHDPGGERRLLRVALPGDEDLVCLSVSCPSTGRHYLLRVPPTMARCRQAAAWLAGFDDEAQFAPLIET